MRKPRSEVVNPGGPNHIMQRGNNRRRLFSFASDYLRFMRLVFVHARSNDILVHALCLMTNHIHMLATPPSVQALSRWIHDYGQAYARYRNDSRNGSGKLFEERYRSVPVLGESQLVATTLYIERNPIDAGMCEQPGEHLWSSYRLHADMPRSRIATDELTPTAWYMGLGRNQAERAAAYVRAFANYDASKLTERQRRLAARANQASEPYTRRLLRPDGSRARDTGPVWPNE